MARGGSIIGLPPGDRNVDLSVYPTPSVDVWLNHLNFVPLPVLVNVFQMCPCPKLQRAFPGNAYHYPPDQER